MSLSRETDLLGNALPRSRVINREKICELRRGNDYVFLSRLTLEDGSYRVEEIDCGAICVLEPNTTVRNGVAHILELISSGAGNEFSRIFPLGHRILEREQAKNQVLA